MQEQNVVRASRGAALATLIDPTRTGVDLGSTRLVLVEDVAPEMMMAEASSAPFEAGQIIACRYRVERMLGSGAFGEVYLVRHTELDIFFAIKVLLPGFSDDEEFIGRLREEARAAARVKHPGIVQVTDVAQMEGGRWYIVMEYLQGQTLASALEALGENPQLKVSRAVEIARQVARAMEAAHEKGIVHRDLKPENIFLMRAADGSEQAKVVDFGLAQSTRRLGGMPAEVAGSPMYMAPEQVEGRPADPRSDIYTLAVILFEIIAGRWPHDLPQEGMAQERIRAVYDAKREVAPPLVTEFRPEVPDGIAQLLRDALAINPNARPQSMAEFADRLRAAMKARSTDVAPRRQRPARSGGLLGTFLGLVVVSVIVTAGLLAWREGDPASFAKFAGGAREVARVVREVSRSAVEWVREGLKGVELPEFLRPDEPASKSTDAPKVKEAPKKTETPSVRRKAKRRRARVRATAAAPDASSSAPRAEPAKP